MSSVIKKINQPLASQDIGKKDNELSDQTNQFEMSIRTLKDSNCALEEKSPLQQSQRSSCRKLNQIPPYKIGWITTKIQVPASKGISSSSCQ